jgi:hypothetical protein
VITRRGLHKIGLVMWIVMAILFAVGCFAMGAILPGVIAVVIIFGGTILSLKIFPIPKA